jgi:hypothetical protein
LTVSTVYGDMVISREFAADSRKVEFDTSKPIGVDCPVR